MVTAKDIIEKLGLVPHPEEGGYYLETYRSKESAPHPALPPRYPSDRSFGTAIYYLLTPDTFSALHRLHSDEIFHFYLGDPVILLELEPDGESRVSRLGQDLLAGEQVQAVVQRGNWFGARLAEGGRFALMGTMVAPGFEFEDYETGNREDLLQQYPSQREWITKLTSSK